MQISCPECRRALPTSAINLDRLVGKCDDCNRLFDCSAQLPEPKLPARRQRWREPVPLPKGVTIDVTGGDDSLLESGYRSESPTVTGTLTIARRWLPAAKGVAFKAVFAAMWCGFLVVWYSAVLGSNAGLLFVLFPLIHVSVGIGLIYWVLADLLNTTTITADATKLTIRHAPLWFPGTKQVAVATLDQLYCKEIIKTSRGEHGTTTSYSYSVFARLSDRRELPLLRNLPDPGQALFIEQQLEAHLHIIDAPVRGELRT